MAFLSPSLVGYLLYLAATPHWSLSRVWWGAY